MEKSEAILERNAAEDLVKVVEAYNEVIPELLEEIDRLKKENRILRAKLSPRAKSKPKEQPQKKPVSPGRKSGCPSGKNSKSIKSVRKSSTVN